MKKKRYFKTFLIITIILLIKSCLDKIDIINNLKANQNKQKKTIDTLEKWIRMGNKCVSEYLKENKISTVAIYGCGIIGKALADVLEQEDISVTCFIDRASDSIDSPIPIFRPTDVFPDIDLIIVTVIDSFDEISEYLEKSAQCPMVSIENLISIIQKNN